MFTTNITNVFRQRALVTIKPWREKSPVLLNIMTDLATSNLRFVVFHSDIHPGTYQFAVLNKWRLMGNQLKKDNEYGLRTKRVEY